MRRETKSHKYILVFTLFSVLVTIALIIALTVYQRAIVSFSRASAQINTFNANSISDSSYYSDGIISDFDVIGKSGLVRTNLSGQSGAVRALSVFEDDSDNRFVLPSNLSENVQLLRISTNSGKLGSIKHYFYAQQLEVNGKVTPVLGTMIRVDMKGNTSVGIGATVVNSKKVLSGDVIESQAQENAVNHAKKYFIKNPVICSDKTEEIIVNRRLFDKNFPSDSVLTYGVDICDDSKNPSFYYRFYVSTVNGSVIFAKDFVVDALNRHVADCSTGADPCPERFEGGPLIGGEGDKVYDILLPVYNFFKATFGRDSYDNLGGLIDVVIYPSNFIDQVFKIGCPNSAWLHYPARGVTKSRGVLWTCKDMNVLDVIVHEFAHGVTFNTADLLTFNQSGALSEGLSDVFAHSVDREDWKIGEDLPYGMLRQMDKPTEKVVVNWPQGKSTYRQPDRLSSPYYSCSYVNDPTTDQGDGGSHDNAGVLNYAFYLMVTGGDFNGCKINGIGEDKAIKIIYRAQTVYLRPTSNYLNMYTGINQSCNDIFGASSNECLQVDNALKAVEMDQQPAGQQRGPKCLGMTLRTPNCIQQTPSITPEPTAIPSPTSGNSVSCVFRPVVKVWQSPYAGGDDANYLINTNNRAEKWGTQNNKSIETYGNNTNHWNRFVDGVYSPCGVSGCVITKSTCCGPATNQYQIVSGDVASVKLYYDNDNYRIVKQCFGATEQTIDCYNVLNKANNDVMDNLPVACGQSFVYGWVLEPKSTQNSSIKL